jgi:hypothetical protein
MAMVWYVINANTCAKAALLSGLARCGAGPDMSRLEAVGNAHEKHPDPVVAPLCICPRPEGPGLSTQTRAARAL